VKELLSEEQLFEHWEGHRRLTLRVIEKFPEDKLFSFNVEPMRTFGELATEIINVESIVFHGMTTGDWKWEQHHKGITSKEILLNAVQRTRAKTLELWPSLTPESFQKVETDGWGATMPNINRIFYCIDNEIHHRAQGYVYLRLLGIEPPAFYER
jgi:uncharacterized damage-inducible protein DinB